MLKSRSYNFINNNNCLFPGRNKLEINCKIVEMWNENNRNIIEYFSITFNTKILWILEIINKKITKRNKK